MMTCSWDWNLRFNIPYVYFHYIGCDYNVESYIDIKPKSTYTYSRPVKKSYIMDYSCKYGLLNPLLKNTKLGLIIIDDDILEPSYYKFPNWSYRDAISDTAKWQIVWSNEFDLSEVIN